MEKEENKTIFARDEVIELLDRFAFFFTDNGKKDTTAEEWLGWYYPIKKTKKIKK